MLKIHQCRGCWILSQRSPGEKQVNILETQVCHTLGQFTVPSHHIMDVFVETCKLNTAVKYTYADSNCDSVFCHPLLLPLITLCSSAFPGLQQQTRAQSNSLSFTLVWTIGTHSINTPTHTDKCTPLQESNTHNIPGLWCTLLILPLGHFRCSNTHIHTHTGASVSAL